MTILVTGSTGTIGSQVIERLSGRAEVHALVRDPAKARFPAGITVVKGDLLDVDAMRSALSQTSTLFLLNAVTPDELTQALIALNLAKEAGIKRIVYFSVFHSGLYSNVPHFAGKHTVERMIEQTDLPASILRPAYFMQNDLALKDAILGDGVYPMPIGSVGLSMVDTRDIADAAAGELLLREQAQAPLPRSVIDLVGPDILTGEKAAAIWSEVLGREIRYGGDDAAAFERNLKTYAPGWKAFDLRLMVERFQSDGMMADQAVVDRLAHLLGRPLKSYRDFAAETAAQWQQG